MQPHIIKGLFNLLTDKFTCKILVGFSFFCLVCLIINIHLGFLVILCFSAACISTLTLLNDQNLIEKLKDVITKKVVGQTQKNDDCGVCGALSCSRHGKLETDAWKQIKITKELDQSIESFLNKILNSFINIWFENISHDKTFLLGLRQNLRQFISRLVLRIMHVDHSVIITEKLLPVVFKHLEILKKIIHEENIPLEKVPHHFIMNDYSVHPATLNRKSELLYLRDIATHLIPFLFTLSTHECRLFSTLLRELFSCWLLLPVMDVISDPNLINLLIVIATNPRSVTDVKEGNQNELVTFLESFVDHSKGTLKKENIETMDDQILEDQQKLYSFMTYLKREDNVDILRFYLDVENLNKQLNEPHIISDPTKLSSLQQQSEKLLNQYKASQFKNQSNKITDLNEAHREVKDYLQQKYKTEFNKTFEYFALVYGDNELKDLPDGPSSLDSASGNSMKFSAKLKDVMSHRTIEGFEATETPLVWDAFVDEAQNTNYYSSVAVKLRKERGQDLEGFMATLMHSVEQSVDYGDEANDEKKFLFKKPNKPGNNLLFGNLFDLKASSKLVHHNIGSLPTSTASQCLIYILVNILKAPNLLVRQLVAVCNLMTNVIDQLLCMQLSKLIKKLLDHNKLAKLITSLEDRLFGVKLSDPNAQELLHRKQLAQERLESLRTGLGELATYLQYPTLNKHLNYSLLDIILLELYPELNMSDENEHAKDYSI